MNLANLVPKDRSDFCRLYCREISTERVNPESWWVGLMCDSAHLFFGTFVGTHSKEPWEASTKGLPTRPRTVGLDLLESDLFPARPLFWQGFFFWAPFLAGMQRMAAKRKRRTESTDPDDQPRPRRGRRTMRRLVVFLLLVVAAVAAAPAIIANTPLRDTLLGWAMPDGRWGIRTGRTVLTWTGAQTLEQVEIVDPEGKPLMVVGSITLDRSLLALITDQNDLGKLRVQQPVVYLVSRPDGSNVEDFIAGLASQPAPPGDAVQTPGKPTTIEIEVVDGEVRGFDAASQRGWALTGAGAIVKLGATPGGLEATGSAKLAMGQDEAAGGLKFRLQQIAQDQRQLDLLADHLPLEPLQPFLARVLPGAWINGTASTDARTLLAVDPQGRLQLQSTGRLEVSGLDMQADALAGDRLQFGVVKAPWQLSLVGDEVQVEQLAVEADWVKLSARGTFSLSELSSLDLKNLPRRESTVTGQVQLERLSAMLPNTLQLREGVWIDSGNMEFRAAGKLRGDSFAWSASTTVENVVGNDGRRAIRWEQPIEAKVELVDTPRGPQMQELSLTAPFAEAKFETAEERVSGSFQFDLEKLSQELGQFVDLAAWRFQGRGEGTLALRPGVGDQFNANAQLKLTELNVTQDSKLVWTEPQLEVELRAAGEAVDFTPRQIATAALKLRGARDTFDAELLQPVAVGDNSQPWKLKVEGNGPLASWAGRLRPWVDGVPEQLEGEAHLQATLVAAHDFVHVVESAGSIAQLQIRKDAMVVDEPRVEFTGDVRWEPAAGNVASQELWLKSSTLAFRSRSISLQLGPTGVPTATGSVAFRADLQRVSSAAGLIGKRDASWLRGAAIGNLQLTSDARQLQADFSAEVKGLEVVRAASATAVYGSPEIAWTEPRLQSSGKLVYTIADDRAVLDNFSFNGQTIRVGGSASVDKLQGEALMHAGGTLEYNADALAKLVQAYLGPEVGLQGDQKVRFQLAGRLNDLSSAGTHWSQRFSASADAGWTVASVFGLPLGGGRIQGTLRDGQLQVAPINVTVGEGRLTAHPRAVFSPGPEFVVLPQGPLVTNVEISQQVSEAMLKYVAPIIAGATRAQGKFSIELQSAQVPLADPKLARVLGRLNVHQLDISPGPIVQDFAAIVHQLESLSKRGQFLQAATTSRETKSLSMTDRKIDFQVSEGRVYHRNLEFVVDNVPVRSYGSVGFDQTLSLMLEIPIQDKWLGDEKAFQSLAGQMLKIPVTGTFQNPRIDSSAVADLSQKLLQGAATQVIGDELNRALDKLFKPR